VRDFQPLLAHVGHQRLDVFRGQLGEPDLPERRTMRLTGISILKVETGMITEEKGLDDGVTMLKQAGLIPTS
jgi:hypothetical protein